MPGWLGHVLNPVHNTAVLLFQAVDHIAEAVFFKLESVERLSLDYFRNEKRIFGLKRLCERAKELIVTPVSEGYVVLGAVHTATAITSLQLFKYGNMSSHVEDSRFARRLLGRGQLRRFVCDVLLGLRTAFDLLSPSHSLVELHAALDLVRETTADGYGPGKDGAQALEELNTLVDYLNQSDSLRTVSLQALWTSVGLAHNDEINGKMIKKSADN